MTHPTPPHITPEMVEAATKAIFDVAKELVWLQCETLATTALTAAPAAQWRPIETMPDEYCHILVVTEDGDVWTWNPHNGPPVSTKFTHWQPLPPPPQEKQPCSPEQS